MQAKIKLTANTYLSFCGCCREALTFYKESLNGEMKIRTYDGSPMRVPEDYKHKVMHGVVKFGDAVIMAADCMPGQEITHGNGSAILLNVTSLEEGESIFKRLSEGGKISMPFDNTFWGARFGMFTDKFGINWMVSFEKKEA